MDFTSTPRLAPLGGRRNTLNVGGDLRLLGRSYVATDVYYGSGFTSGHPGLPYPGEYPADTTFDLSLGKIFSERFSASLNALNLSRVELDNSLTFGGFHWNYPRAIYVQLHYKFHS
jgi:hypothetical protein